MGKCKNCGHRTFKLGGLIQHSQSMKGNNMRCWAWVKETQKTCTCSSTELPSIYGVKYTPTNGETL